MSKKKKHKKKVDFGYLRDYEVSDNFDKKKINKKYRDIIKEIENDRMYLYEVDKRLDRSKRRKINKEAKEFYTDIKSLKARQKLAKKWEKDGLLDYLIAGFKNLIPVIRNVAKMVMSLIILFLSLPAVRENVSIGTLTKLDTLYRMASIL